MKDSIAELLTRHRWGLSGLFSTVLLVVLLVQTVPFAHMAWGALTGGPGLGLVHDVRGALLQQPPFRKAIAEHEREALRRHRQGKEASFQRRRLVRVNLTPFGLPGFHDVFAVRVRTDIVEGKPYTSFLARPGVLIESSTSSFFSGQCQRWGCERVIRGLIGIGHQLLEWGVLSSYRLNVTETDATSSVSVGREAIPTDTWARQSRRLHQDRIGHSFAPAPQ